MCSEWLGHVSEWLGCVASHWVCTRRHLGRYASTVRTMRDAIPAMHVEDVIRSAGVSVRVNRRYEAENGGWLCFRGPNACKDAF